MSGTMLIITRSNTDEWFSVRGLQNPPTVELDGEEMEPGEARELADALIEAADYADRIGDGSISMHLTRWAILKNGEQFRNIVKMPRCETYEKAVRHAEEKAKAYPQGAPYRIVRIDMAVTEDNTRPAGAGEGAER